MNPIGKDEHNGHGCEDESHKDDLDKPIADENSHCQEHNGHKCEKRPTNPLQLLNHLLMRPSDFEFQLSISVESSMDKRTMKPKKTMNKRQSRGIMKLQRCVSQKITRHIDKVFEAHQPSIKIIANVGLHGSFERFASLFFTMVCETMISTWIMKNNLGTEKRVWLLDEETPGGFLQLGT